jgi:hypothetical protein
MVTVRCCGASDEKPQVDDVLKKKEASSLFFL